MQYFNVKGKRNFSNSMLKNKKSVIKEIQSEKFYKMVPKNK